MKSAALLALAVPLALSLLPGTAPAQNLVANPLLLRDLPPPGWIANRRADWIAHHSVYQATCRTADVAKEVVFLNRVVGRDETLLNLAGNPPQGNSPAAREAQLAKREMGLLRNDIAAADQLVALLQALPDCSPGATEATPAKEAAAPGPAPEPAPSAAAPPPAAAIAKPAAPEAAQVTILRYDDKVAALTPRSVRAFEQAVEAIRAGKQVNLAIDGCGSGADLSTGSVCGERLRSLRVLLKKNGVRDPKRFVADAP